MCCFRGLERHKFSVLKICKYCIGLILLGCFVGWLEEDRAFGDGAATLAMVGDHSGQK